MNQQQLQTARAALWHQTAPLLTADQATAWLNDLGLCLFLPRHAQLPAPAPSFVEAVHGAPGATPPPKTLQHATELAARLIDERRLVPLNLLGTFSEQPDFVVTPEILPWLAAIRGDRQWKTAPGGRPAPIVLRTWEALDREGESTAVQLREILGRELTEAAVLRALVELWTSLRAMPIALPGEPTRWTLLKNRFPAQLATGANIAQSTGLSALLSIYLRSAVAATAEEAEIFLSPLTARSRIREVVHGMTAARQLGSMSVGSHTLLFVPGSLPENLSVEPEASAAPPAIPASRPRPEAPRSRPPFRKEFRPRPREARASQTPSRGPIQRRPDGKPWRPREQRPPHQERPRLEGEHPRQQQPPRPGQARPDRRERNEHPDQRSRENRPDRRESPFRPGQSSSRPDRRPLDRGPREQRPRFGGENRSQQKPGFRKPGPQSFGRPKPGSKRFERKKPDAKTGTGPEARRFDRGPREQRPRFGGENRSQQGPGFRKSGPKPFGRPKPGSKPFEGKKPGAKSFTGPRPKFPPKREDRESPAGSRKPRPYPKPRFAKSAAPHVSAGRHFNRNKNFKPRLNKNLRKPNPDKRNPRKNRSQDENPE